MRAVERAHVGVDLQQVLLGLEVDGRGGDRGEHALDLRGRHVVAEHEPLEPLERGARVGLGGLEAHAIGLGAGRLVVLERVDLQQRLAGRDVDVGADEHLAHACPATGAVSEVSIFMLSVTATTSPALTSSPAETGMATTTPGEWLRTRPPSSREMRCGTPLTSTSRSESCSAVIVR